MQRPFGRREHRLLCLTMAGPQHEPGCGEQGASDEGCQGRNVEPRDGRRQGTDAQREDALHPPHGR